MFFLALTFAGSRGSCFNMRLQAECSNHLLRDPANVNCNETDMGDRFSLISCILPDSSLK